MPMTPAKPRARVVRVILGSIAEMKAKDESNNRFVQAHTATFGVGQEESAFTSGRLSNKSEIQQERG